MCPVMMVTFPERRTLEFSKRQSTWGWKVSSRFGTRPSKKYIGVTIVLSNGAADMLGPVPGNHLAYNPNPPSGDNVAALSALPLNGGTGSEISDGGFVLSIAISLPLLDTPSSAAHAAYVADALTVPVVRSTFADIPKKLTAAIAYRQGPVMSTKDTPSVAPGFELAVALVLSIASSFRPERGPLPVVKVQCEKAK